MQSNPRISVNLLVMSVKLLVNLLVKLTKLGIGGAIGAWGLGCTPVLCRNGPSRQPAFMFSPGLVPRRWDYGTSLTTEPTPPPDGPP